MAINVKGTFWEVWHSPYGARNVSIALLSGASRTGSRASVSLSVDVSLAAHSNSLTKSGLGIGTDVSIEVSSRSLTHSNFEWPEPFQSLTLSRSGLVIDTKISLTADDHSLTRGYIDPISITMFAPVSRSGTRIYIDLIPLQTISVDAAPGSGNGSFVLTCIILASPTGNGIGGGSDGLYRLTDILLTDGAGVGSGEVTEFLVFDIKPRLWRSSSTRSRKDVDSLRFSKSV